MPDQPLLREKAREAIRVGKLPISRPSRTFGGGRRGHVCSVCGQSIPRDQVELERRLHRRPSLASAPSRSQFSSRSTPVGGVGPSACLLQEEVNHVKICLEITGTDEGERRGVLFQRKPERLSLLGLSEPVEASAEVFRRLIRKPDSVLAGRAGWSRPTVTSDACGVGDAWRNATIGRPESTRDGMVKFA